MSAFVHLHGHSEFSIVDGLSRIPDMVSRAKELGMEAIALTDHGDMYGAIYFYKEAIAQGIKPIIGCEVYVTEGSRFDKGARERLKHLVLLAETNEGYQNIVKIVSKAHTEGFHYKPRADRELLERYKEGVIALSACIAGEIPQYILQDNIDGAKRALEWYLNTYGKDHFFLEIQNHGDPKELKAQDAILDLADEYGVQVVCTNDFHYVHKEDADAHDIKVCIQSGKKRDDVNRLKFYNDEFYLKSPEEMADLFPHVPEALANTVKIAERCHVEFDFTKHHLPHFDVPEGETSASYLRKVCEAEIPKHYEQDSVELRERINYELGVIGKMGFDDYFLIVWDYVKYSREHNILVGPGRGSAAGSVVAYLLGITGLDPLKYNLLFERFLNPERVSMPDIDIDFCYERRGEVIDYVTAKYGQERVAQIVTFGTEAARAVIRDVGRVLDVPLPEVNRLAKLIPNELGITLTKALEVKELKDMYEADATVRELFDFGLKLEGITRNSSTHAAGVVIAGRDVDDYVPVQRANDGFVTQYDKDNIEELGLLKMDFLGLRTLTVMDEAVRLIEQNRGIRIDLDKIDLADKKTCDMLAAGETAGVFQLESDGITKLVMDLKPEHFEDLIPLVALYRPGPLGSGMVDDFIKRRHGEREVTYLHPSLEPILKDTFGVILYQEQVMQIASAMGGFTLGQADLMRRAMGKKKESVLRAQRDSFVTGSVNNNISEALANEVFDLLLYFAGYGFNKSHSAAYAYIAYQTAYLKAHYFPEFLAATMSSFMERKDKLTYYINECRRHGIEVLGPRVNQSERYFTVEGSNIRFGLGGIKNVGDNAIDDLVREREAHGTYTSLMDFCSRVDYRYTNKRLLEGLIRCGAMDDFGYNRAELLGVYEQIQAIGSKEQKNEAQGAVNLFGELEEATEVPIPRIQDLPDDVKLKDEKEYTGFYITGHPLGSYEAELKQLFPLGKLLEGAEKYDQHDVKFGGLIVDKVERVTRQREELMATIQVEDFTGTVNAVIFPKTYREYKSLIQLDNAVRMEGRIDADEKGLQIIVSKVKPLRIDEDSVRGIIIHIRPEYDTPANSGALKSILQSTAGSTPVKLYLHAQRKSIAVGSAMYIPPTGDVVEQIESVLGPNSVELVY